MAGERTPPDGIGQRDWGCSIEIRDVGRGVTAEYFAAAAVFDTDAEFSADIDAPIIGRQAWEAVRREKTEAEGVFENRYCY